ncbi:MAG: hypothetical protein R2879_18745 [Saprospiraceae bacterium]
MRTILAEELLYKIMEWSPDRIREERPLIQALSLYKYNNYQQFTPGMRFIESLGRWLKQINGKDEKELAYNFLKKNLIFFSNEQVHHLVSLAYPLVVDPLIKKLTAKDLNISDYLLSKIVSSNEYSINKRRALFIGLSDGAKIDYFRRSSGISNEQVYPTYQISDEKAADLVIQLEKEINYKTFNTVFLLDDFTASGKSYFRIEGKEEKGKIPKFLNQYINSSNSEVTRLFDFKNLTIIIIFYIATESAIDSIKSSIEKWKFEKKSNINILVNAIQILGQQITDSLKSDENLVNLLKKYFDPELIDMHYKKGNHNFPYFGFNECALPLILNHNTPNNSLPILWMPEDKKYVGLFPRVTRHKE